VLLSGNTLRASKESSQALEERVVATTMTDTRLGSHRRRRPLRMMTSMR
jgi:hypothetical protein